MSSKTVAESSAGAAGRARSRWSLAARLTAWYALSAFAIVGIASGLLYWVLWTNLLREDDEFLLSKIQVIRELLADYPSSMDMIRWTVGEAHRAPHHAMQVYVRLSDRQGNKVLATPWMDERLGAGILAPPAVMDQPLDRGFDVYSRSGERFHVMTSEASVGRAGQERWLVQVAIVEVAEDSLLAAYRRRLWLVLGIAVIVCAAAGYWIARAGIRPMREITVAARRIRSTTLDQRIEVAGLPAELADFAATFNEMLDRLEAAFARLSRFSADIAHELRTPLNNLRGEAEVALGQERSLPEYREALSSCLEECGRLSRLIDNMLLLARAENPQTVIRRERLDIGRELATIREFYGAHAEEAGIAVVIEAPEGWQVALDRTLFQRAIGNLLENALVHTPRGGTVWLRAGPCDGGAQVEVADTGSGIPAEHLPHVFDRFHRADGARSRSSGGAGLGLAIVKSVAVLHGGTVQIDSQSGAGTRVRLTFPPAG